MSAPISHLGAVGLAIAAFTFFVLCDSTVKLAGQSQLPNYEITAFLGLFMAVFIGAYSAVRGEAGELWPSKPGPVLMRALLEAGNNLFIVVALRHLSLTLFYILVFMSPMIVAIGGIFLLKERLDWRRVVAIVTGFLGIIIAVDPFGSIGRPSWVGIAATTVCVLCFSGEVIYSRRITQTVRPESIAFVSGLLTAILGFAGMIVFRSEVLTMRLVAVLVLMGLLCTLGAICMLLALKYAVAATVTQYHYTQLLTGAIIAYFAFHEKPTVFMLVGAVLIVVSGLYIAVYGGRADGLKG
jgi:drug/metabolite transporter (DMT)-like permease